MIRADSRGGVRDTVQEGESGEIRIESKSWVAAQRGVKRAWYTAQRAGRGLVCAAGAGASPRHESAGRPENWTAGPVQSGPGPLWSDVGGLCPSGPICKVPGSSGTGQGEGRCSPSCGGPLGSRGHTPAVSRRVGVPCQLAGGGAPPSQPQRSRQTAVHPEAETCTLPVHLPSFLQTQNFQKE